MPRCGRQQFHRDYPVEITSADEAAEHSNYPCGAIIAFQDNTRVWFCDYSHLEEKSKLTEGKLREISLQILLFHGRLVHAGSAYNKMNIRVHPSLVRHPDQYPGYLTEHGTVTFPEESRTPWNVSQHVQLLDMLQPGDQCR